jgi:hypothetical protein
MKLIRQTILLLLLLLPTAMFGQGSQSVDMADSLRAEGKIYVVVLGLLIILTGVVVFLVRVDRKLSRLERKDDR